MVLIAWNNNSRQQEIERNIQKVCTGTAILGAGLLLAWLWHESSTMFYNRSFGESKACFTIGPFRRNMWGWHWSPCAFLKCRNTNKFNPLIQSKSIDTQLKLDSSDKPLEDWCLKKQVDHLTHPAFVQPEMNEMAWVWRPNRGSGPEDRISHKFLWGPKWEALQASTTTVLCKCWTWGGPPAGVRLANAVKELASKHNMSQRGKPHELPSPTARNHLLSCPVPWGQQLATLAEGTEAQQNSKLPQAILWYWKIGWKCCSQLPTRRPSAFVFTIASKPKHASSWTVGWSSTRSHCRFASQCHLCFRLLFYSQSFFDVSHFDGTNTAWKAHWGFLPLHCFSSELLSFNSIWALALCKSTVVLWLSFYCIVWYDMLAVLLVLQILASAVTRCLHQALKNDNWSFTHATPSELPHGRTGSRLRPSRNCACNSA